MKRSCTKPRKRISRLEERQYEYDRYFSADISYTRPGSLNK